MATTAAAFDPATRYNAGARAFHAVIAVLIVTNIVLGIGHDAFEGTAFGIPLHKSIGLTVLFLSLVRLGWRFTWTPPPYAPPLKPFDLKLAKAVHWSFYALMIVLPLTGWIFTSAGNRPIAWFGIPFPKLAVEKGSALPEISHEGHEILGFVMLALIVLHVAAALRHHFMLKDGVLRRIW
jgi:cytochrome b561